MAKRLGGWLLGSFLYIACTSMPCCSLLPPAAMGSHNSQLHSTLNFNPTNHSSTEHKHSNTHTHTHSPCNSLWFWEKLLHWKVFPWSWKRLAWLVLEKAFAVFPGLGKGCGKDSCCRKGWPGWSWKRLGCWKAKWQHSQQHRPQRR